MHFVRLQNFEAKVYNADKGGVQNFEPLQNVFFFQKIMSEHKVV